MGASLFLCACVAPAKKGTPTPPAPVGPHLVGTIFQIKQPEGEAKGFVLVDVGTLYAPAPGKVLKCYSGGLETAEITITPERMTSFITADIVKGTPNRGDQVFE